MLDIQRGDLALQSFLRTLKESPVSQGIKEQCAPRRIKDLASYNIYPFLTKRRVESQSDPP